MWKNYIGRTCLLYLSLYWKCKRACSDSDVLSVEEDEVLCVTRSDHEFKKRSQYDCTNE